MKKRLLMLISALLVASQLIMLAGCAGGGNGTVTTDDGADSICGPNTTSPNGSDTSDTGDGTTSPDTSDTTKPDTPDTPDTPDDPGDTKPTSGYEWGSVPMGAGGFVTGVMIHPTEPDLVYIRTDVGGCYRWDKKNESWIQLMDMFTRDQESFYGVDGLALDANNPDVIYLAAGGVPTALISIPVWFMHTANEMVHPDDMKAASDLVAAVIRDKFGAVAEKEEA